MNSRAPLIVAIVLLLLPVLYVGSYFALVLPGGVEYSPVVFRLRNGKEVRSYPLRTTHYRVGRERSSGFFWPLEQIDRRVRSKEWNPDRFENVYNGP